MQVLELEQSGFEHFRERDWATAAQAFNEAVSLQPSVRLAALYLERIAHYQAHPPADNLDGVWTMTSK